MFNFKKIASVLSSAVMLSSTVALAAAASYPDPFVKSGAADVAVVYGSTAATTDLVAVTDITANLQAKLAAQTASGSTATGATASGGDFVKLEKAATKFNLGNGILDVVSGTVTDDDLGTLLKDGQFLDSDNNEKDYTQKLTLGNLSLTLFEDSDYKADTPTIGFQVSSGTFVLNYTLDFSDQPAWADLANTELEVMGKEYFISSVTTNTTINLLDAATKTTVNEGDSVTVTVGEKTYEVSAKVYSGTQAVLVVNGVQTNSLNEGQTFHLGDGVYVGVKDIFYVSKETGVSSVVFSVGSGKIELRDGSDVKINEKTVNGLTVDLTNSNENLQKIVLTWNTDDDMFITEDSSIMMPGFDNIELSFGGMTFPATETFSIEKGSNTYLQLNSFPLKDGSATIPILYGNGTTFSGIGKESTKLLLTSNNTVITFDKNSHEQFVATFNDGTNAESYLLRATGFSTENGINKTTIQSYKDGSWVEKKTDAVNGDTVNIGSVALTIGYVDKNAGTVVITGGSSVNFNTLYSEDGLKVYLPWSYFSNNYTANGLAATKPGALNTNSTAQGYVSPTTFRLDLVEENKNGNKGSGNAINATLGWTSDKGTVSSVTGVGISTGLEVGDSDDMRYFIYSPLATELLHKTGGDQDSVSITYHGDESYGNVFVIESGATIAPGTSSSGTVKELGNVVVKDSEVSSVSSKNLVVVGGSCVNSVAASLLGLSASSCGSAWETKTGVGAGSFLIQSFDRGSGKIATLVAGYNAGDTTNAAKALTTQSIDTSAGKKYTGTSATSVSLVTQTA